jgi:hypothetical protein
MALPLATDIRISHGDDTVRLVPSLRAAYLLNQRHGMGKLVDGINEGSLSIILDIISKSGNAVAALALVERKLQAHFGKALADLQEQAFQFLAACFGVDDDPDIDHPADKPGESFDLQKALADLFEIATGCLGWTPTDAWAATPAEIMAAQRGLITKLKAVNGTAEAEPEHDPREEVSEAEVRTGLARLRAEARRGRQQ